MEEVLSGRSIILRVVSTSQSSRRHPDRPSLVFTLRRTRRRRSVKEKKNTKQMLVNNGTKIGKKKKKRWINMGESIQVDWLYWGNREQWSVRDDVWIERETRKRRYKVLFGTVMSSVRLAGTSWRNTIFGTWFTMGKGRSTDGRLVVLSPVIAGANRALVSWVTEERVIRVAYVSRSFDWLMTWSSP